MRKLANASENPNIWKKEVTCTGAGWQQTGTPCHSLFEIDARDIKRRTHTDYGGGTDTYYGFVCPDCGCFTEIPSKDIPSHVKSNAPKYVIPSKDDL